MFDKILLPLDGSHLSESAIPVTLEMAKRFEASVILVHVVEPARYATEIAPLDAPGQIEGVLEQSQRRDRANLAKARRYLADIRERLVGRGIETTTHVLIGPVTKALLQVNKTDGIDLVIMSTHGRSGIRRSVLGSKAEEMVRESSTPVLLIALQNGGTFRSRLTLPVFTRTKKPTDFIGRLLLLSR